MDGLTHCTAATTNGNGRTFEGNFRVRVTINNVLHTYASSMATHYLAYPDKS